MITRSDIVACARTYIDTRYHHAARTKGLGIDCGGLLIAVCRELGLVTPDFDVPQYGPRPDGRTLLSWCEQYMGRQLRRDEIAPGDALVMITDVRPQHIGVVADYHYRGLSLVHAANGAHPPRVIETRLMFFRRQRFVSAFAFPGIE